MSGIKPICRWVTAKVDNDVVTKLSEELGVTRHTASVLCSRGYVDAAELKSYLNPRLFDLTDPFEMPGMKKAVNCIFSAIDKGRRIVIFGDYDVDGLTATALLVQVLKCFGADCSPFIPRREDEGYGLTKKATDRCLLEKSPEVIITVDCGSNADKVISSLTARGVEVVVTDHHEVNEKDSSATAVVNPKRNRARATECLAGVGVAFKLCFALQKRAINTGRTEAGKLDLRNYLDLVAVGTVADLAPLVGENRILVKSGLSRIASSAGHGLRELAKVAGLDGCRNCEDIAFRIGPRLNAAGRTGDATIALELLLTRDKARARLLAEALEEANNLRRETEKRVTMEAQLSAEADFEKDPGFAIVVVGDYWPVGVIGIVASRLSSRYNRPAVVLSNSGEAEYRGSARSPDGIDFSLIQALNECSGLMKECGGHESAAGLEISRENVHIFRSRFKSICQNKLENKDLTRQINIDSWISMTELSMEFLEEIEKLAPFGLGNRAPVWGVKGAELAGKPRVVGTNHAKLQFAGRSGAIDAIGFGMGHNVPSAGSQVDVVFELSRNFWQGRMSVQMVIKDMATASV